MTGASPIAPGEVWLVGAGPGDPDLLTRKAEKLIRAADIVFYDALVGPGILDLIPHGTEQVSVGKRAGRHSKDQDTINDLIVRAALAGRRVVRLKGGDPSIFGRSMEEMAALARHGVAARICPGITAASAAAASASISLTLRGLARKLLFVTAHVREGEILDLDWDALADPGATLAVYMGKSSAGMIARRLMASGLAAATPVLAIENASLPDERIVRTRLDLLEIAARALGSGPALLLIGDAVGAASPISGASAAVRAPARSGGR
ncbi:MAG TPA: uroporphyrinogen-III C-methyltransferase [Sphingobium sp.]|uniref:uroporphyrinogen-III C-methyltransferase n=1 Tax=Sphingobium sp. TaxID=1912891 RepID=UPI002ED31D80